MKSISVLYSNMNQLLGRETGDITELEQVYKGSPLVEFLVNLWRTKNSISVSNEMQASLKRNRLIFTSVRGRLSSSEFNYNTPAKNYHIITEELNKLSTIVSGYRAYSYEDKIMVSEYFTDNTVRIAYLIVSGLLIKELKVKGLKPVLEWNIEDYKEFMEMISNVSISGFRNILHLIGLDVRDCEQLYASQGYLIDTTVQNFLYKDEWKLKLTEEINSDNTIFHSTQGYKNDNNVQYELYKKQDSRKSTEDTSISNTEYF